MYRNFLELSYGYLFLSYYWVFPMNGSINSNTTKCCPLRNKSAFYQDSTTTFKDGSTMDDFNKPSSIGRPGMNHGTTIL